jgi:F0F1-type ATP synthase assembly protein I
MDQKRGSTADTMRTIGALSTVGFSMVLAVVIGAGIGYFLMTRFGLGRWVFFLGFVFGVAAGIINIYRTAGRILK